MSLFRPRAASLSALEQILDGRGLGRRGGTMPNASRRSALTHSAVWASLRLRADLLSTMPVDAFRKRDGVQIETPKPPVLVSPGGDEVGIIEWLYSTQFDLDSCGNTFGLIRTRDGMGLPSRIDLVPVEDVTVLVKKGVKSYRIAGVEYDAAEVWHERQFTTSGSPVGLSPLAYSASSISGYVSAQEFVRQWFAGGAVPSAHLRNSEKTLVPAETKAVKAQFKESVTSGDVFVTGKDWEYSMLSAKANEAGMIDSLRWGVGDAARFYGVPGDMIDAEVSSGSITYANITQRNLQFLITNLGPAVARREDALSSLLPRPRFVKLNTGALLRMDLKSRYESYKTSTGGRPFMAPSEARALENLPPFTPEQLAELSAVTAAPAAPTVGGADGPSAE